MIVKKSDIGLAVDKVFNNATLVVASGKIQIPKDMVIAVIVSQESVDTWFVGWHFEKANYGIGDTVSFDDGTVGGSKAVIYKVLRGV